LPAVSIAATRQKYGEASRGAGGVKLVEGLIYNIGRSKASVVLNWIV
jgi:hypothetical protein